MDSSRKIYDQRREPACLVIKKGVDYINLRTCQDKSVLECVLDELESSGDDAVIIPWLSPPFNIPRGYGIYSRSTAKELARLDLEEHWVSPTLGRKYDQNRLRRKIASLSDQVIVVK